MIGWTLAPIIHFIEKYVFSDWEYLKFLFVITSADTALGFVKAIKLHQLSSRGFSMIFTKFTMYACALIATHVLVHFSVANKTYVVFSWFDTVIFSAIVVREAISIFENIALIEPNLFPSSILKYLHQFDSLTGKKMDQPNS
jgi:toxin secretion/phage lysis holin